MPVRLKYKPLATTCVAILALTTSIFFLPMQPVHAATNKVAEVGMPFEGKWGSTQSGQANMHAIHGTGYHWAQDLFANGVDVKLNVSAPAGGNLSFSLVGTWNSCGGTGGGIKIGVYVDGESVGEVSYAHLDQMVTQGPITNGMTLGKTKKWSYVDEYWMVATDAGVHTHFEAKSDSGNYSCYHDRSVTSQVNNGAPIARLGKTNATGIQQPCTETPSGSTAATLARPAAIAYNGALNVFIRGGDNQIYAQHWNGNTWTGFASIGGNMKSDPALIENNGALNVFAIGQDGQVYTKYNNGNGWSGWASMGPTTMKGNPFVMRYDNEINLFALSANNVPYKNTWQPNTGWSGWASMGNFMDSSPSAVQHGSDLNVAMRGGNNHVYNNRWNGSSWSGFGSLGPSLAGNPDTISYGGLYDIWAVSPGGGLWKQTWNGDNWSGWTWMGDGFHGNPDAMQYNSDLNVFARGGNGQVYHRYWSASGQSWSGWTSLGGNIAGDPTAIQYGQELSVFAVGADGKTYKNTFHPSSGWGGFAALPS